MAFPQDDSSGARAVNQSRAHAANRLARESSPYLLQHAHNPVDWFPWGAEAFEDARRRDVPIFLSIGYSTCYWCHVMERESFESAPIARALNEAFVCVKVDREERPDVDEAYMAATQIMTGHGGWPMSCFLEPRSLRPFLCGTYFPPESRHGRPGFLDLALGVSKAWAERRADVLAQAEALASDVREQMQGQSHRAALTIDHAAQAVGALLGMLDRVHGGFGSAPKFPQPVFLELLLDVRDRAGDDATRSAIDHACTLTLDRMALGGLFDQVGGGFHRYSVDAAWTVPHFEKMLYDNAQLGALYARASETYHDPFYRTIAERTFAYVMREMTGGDGFFSAQDAEVDGREGANYIWTPDQVRAVLSPDDAAFSIRVYGLDAPANFRDPHHPDAEAWVLRLRDRPEVMAREMSLSESEFAARLDRVNQRLLAARQDRPQPRRDDKRITSWNAMMIAALARSARPHSRPGDAGSGVAHRLSPERDWLRVAERGMASLLSALRDADGDLLRVRAKDARTIRGFLEDFAHTIAALLELHRAGVERAEAVGCLEEAKRLIARAETLFGDGNGGWFDANDGAGELFVRPRSTHDGAMPSGASVTLLDLVDLHAITGEPALLDRAIEALASLSGAIAAAPAGAANAVRSLLRLATMDDARVVARLASIGPMQAESKPASDFTPVEVYANEERVRVAKDRPAVLRLVVRIAPGHHINAADLGPIESTPAGRGLAPLRVKIINGSGIAAYAEYPRGKPFGTQGELFVHEGEIEFRVLLEREGEWAGRPLLALTYQACTATECLEARTVELDVAIDRGD
jgi:uncharacterized protein YyaL (SSP411 family)